MTASRISLRSQHLVLAAVVALTVACKASESGAIPCNADNNCPTTYPQCVGGGSSAGHCTEPVVGTPVLSPTTIAVTPPAITGGLHPTLSLALPAISGNKNLARNVTLGITVGGGVEPVNKSGGAPVTLADLGTTITVDAPATAASDSKLLTYTLTVSNTPSSAAVGIATGTLSVVPAPVLASSSFAITPGSMTGGTSPTLSVALPALSTPAAAVSSVSFTISGCGSGAVVKMSGAAVDTSDLGTTISIAAPVSTATDNKTCTYTLTVNSAATTPVSAIAVGTLAIAPLPVISASSFAVVPAVISSGLSPILTATLPTLTSALAPGTTVDFTISGAGCGSGAVAKAAGGPVGLADLGTTISFTAPASGSTDNDACTYTLSISSGSTVATATATLTVVPAPLLNGVTTTTFTVAPASITGGTAPVLSTTLPVLSQLSPAAATVTYQIANCGTGNVNKTNTPAGAVVGTDLGTGITFASPTTLSTDNKTCNYTLTVSNAATTPASATATGTLVIKPAPTLSFSTLLPNPPVITGGTTAKISIPLPSGTNVSTVTSFTIDDGTGPVQQKKSNAVAVAIGDLNTAITVLPPTTTAATSKTYTYVLTVANNATTPGTTTASGTLTVVPAPLLNGATTTATFTIAPASITGGTAPLLSTTLPVLTQLSPSAATVTYRIANCGTGDVNKTNTPGGAVVATDLGTGITFASPTTLSTDNKTCTYTLTVSNAATTPASATATGTLKVVPLPVLGGAPTVTPNVIVGGTTTKGLLQFLLPALSAGTASTVNMAVTPPIASPTPVTKSNGGAILPGDLGGAAISVDPPSTLTSDPTKVFTYALTATNSNNDKSAPVTATVTSFPPTTAISSARIGATATLLPNGKVLIVGGGTSIASGVCSGAIKTAEVYDPTTGSTVATGNMVVSRCMHTAVLATNNKIYVMGGANNARIDVFVYNAAASPWGAWQADATPSLPTLQQVRVGHSAVLLGPLSTDGSGVNNNGKIAVIGGYDPSSANAGLTNLELFDPAANSGNGVSIPYSYTPGSSSVATTLSAARGEHAAVLIGTWIYLIGGFDGASAYSATIDVLDTTRKVNSSLSNSQITTSSPTGTLSRMGHSAIAIDSSNILVAGGYDGTNVLKSMQKYPVDSTTGGGTVGNVGSGVNLGTARVRFPLLAAGPVNTYVAFGGTNSLGTPDVATSSVEIIDTSGTLSPSSGVALKSLRQALTATNLNLSGASNSAFVVAGGAAAGGAEIYIGP